MINILDLIPSKDIRDYLIKNNYKMDMKNAFYLVMKYAPREKRKEYVKCVIDTCEDKEDFFQSLAYGWGYKILSTWRYFLSELIKNIDDEGYIMPDPETIVGETDFGKFGFAGVDDWDTWQVDLPTPFEGEI